MSILTCQLHNTTSPNAAAGAGYQNVASCPRASSILKASFSGFLAHLRRAAAAKKRARNDELDPSLNSTADLGGPG